MQYIWFVAFTCSIFIAAIIGWVRFNRIDPAFRPFIACLWLGAVNESISICLSLRGMNNFANNNVYVLFEAILLLWQIRRWGGFGDKYRYFPLLAGLLVIAWIAENFIIGTIYSNAPGFRLLYSFIIVLLAIHLFYLQSSDRNFLGIRAQRFQ